MNVSLLLVIWIVATACALTGNEIWYRYQIRRIDAVHDYRIYVLQQLPVGFGLDELRKLPSYDEMFHDRKTWPLSRLNARP
jgi:hypothetical protein